MEGRGEGGEGGGRAALAGGVGRGRGEDGSNRALARRRELRRRRDSEHRRPERRCTLQLGWKTPGWPSPAPWDTVRIPRMLQVRLQCLNRERATEGTLAEISQTTNSRPERPSSLSTNAISRACTKTAAEATVTVYVLGGARRRP